MTPNMIETFAWLRERGFMRATPHVPQTAATQTSRESLPVMQANTFTSWDDVLHAAQSGARLFYHAPMDLRPIRVHVVRVCKNRKIRIKALSGVVFTADSGHLSRFRSAQS